MEQQKLTPKQEKQKVANEITTTLKTEVGTALQDKNISDAVLAQFDKLATQGQLAFPKDYSVGNALKLAYANMVANGVQHCEPLSVANALSEYVIQGLDCSRKQAYFIDYGGKAVMQRSYFGDVCVLLRTGVITKVKAHCIYDGDVIETGYNENGDEVVFKHETKFGNKDNPIIGAYAWAEGINGHREYCIMTKKEIDTAWRMSKNYGQKNKFQNDFSQEASKRTVIRRLAKTLFNTLPSSTQETASLIASYNRSTENEYKNENESNERKLNDVKEVKEVIDFTGSQEKVENPFANNQAPVQPEPVVNETPVVEEPKVEHWGNGANDTFVGDLPLDNDTGEVNNLFDKEF